MRPTLVNVKACFAGTPQESTVEQDLNYFDSKGIVGKIESAKEVLFVMTSAAIDTERMNQIIEETRKAITFEKLVADSTIDVAKQFLPTDYLKWRMRIINVTPANAKQEADKIERTDNHIPTFFLFAKNEAEQAKIRETVSVIFEKVGERCMRRNYVKINFRMRFSPGGKNQGLCMLLQKGVGENGDRFAEEWKSKHFLHTRTTCRNPRITRQTRLA